MRPGSSIERLAAAVTGPRGRWLTIGIWLLLGIAGLIGRTQIGEVTAAGQSSYLPANAESTRVVGVLQRDFKGGDDVPVLVVFERRGGLTDADLNAIGRLGDGLDRLGLAGATPSSPPSPARPSSRSATWRGLRAASGRSPATAKRR